MNVIRLGLFTNLVSFVHFHCQLCFQCEPLFRVCVYCAVAFLLIPSWHVLQPPTPLSQAGMYCSLPLPYPRLACIAASHSFIPRWHVLQPPTPLSQAGMYCNLLLPYPRLACIAAFHSLIPSWHVLQPVISLIPRLHVAACHPSFHGWHVFAACHPSFHG